eukprot:2029877-Amphidinium_carterae.2
MQIIPVVLAGHVEGDEIGTAISWRSASFFASCTKLSSGDSNHSVVNVRPRGSHPPNTHQAVTLGATEECLKKTFRLMTHSLGRKENVLMYTCA